MQMVVRGLMRAFYNMRVRAIMYQIVVLAAVVAAGIYVFATVSHRLAEQNVATGFGYLDREAGFVISEAFLEYKPTDTYGRAILVGITNTLVVSSVSVVLATVLGLIVGVAQLSSNPLLALLARIYVEALRNVPLLLYLFFWYALIVTNLPAVRDAWEILPNVYVTNSGLAIPALRWTGAHAGMLLALLLGIGLAMLFQRRARARRIATGRERSAWPLILLALLGPPIIGFLAFHPDFALSFPEKGRFRIVGGARLTTEFTALLIGLSLAASAGIAEIVRAGILAVQKGQWDASAALGLRNIQAMRLVILPQALRLIVPPLTSSYLSLFKNSSLAIAIGYPDLVMISNTIMNQTGQAIESIAIYMLVYLALSIAISLLMNWYNARVTVKEY